MTNTSNFSRKELKVLSSSRGIQYLLQQGDLNPKEVIDRLNYEEKLKILQAKLIKVQNWVINNQKRIMILFEGREFAGKGMTLNTCIEHLNPRAYRKVALNKPTEKEQGQWYFKRYIEQLPERGEMVFFDRSWYNRAVVEPVNKFCTRKEYKRFMNEVNHFEEMLIGDGIIMIKFYLSISKKEQKSRIKGVQDNPLLRWQLSKVDIEAPGKWNLYTKYTKVMLENTSSFTRPWHIIQADNINTARLEVFDTILKIAASYKN
jgi:polyphosphate kinase 2